ncbi:MAG TPA: hypothetical protein VFF78_05345, partial [Anaerolineaceae bacterium]|nr:hypothetical protein [Anaerolineaceae bacterium]
MNKLFSCAVILVCAVLLVGCDDPLDHIAQPIALPLHSPSNEVIQFAVAIDQQGVKHIVSIECPAGTMDDCIMVYQTYPASTTHTYIPADGYSYVAPDIAVDQMG